jgi:hypothetical protein
LKSFEPDIQKVNVDSFPDIALEVFRHQAVHNKVYKQYLAYLKFDIHRVNTLPEIPFMPINFFKNHRLATGEWQAESTFTSSGTTGAQTSRHPVKSISHYHQHARKCFEGFFGDITQYHFLALLPGYLERPDSSLISMMDYFIKASGSEVSGFYHHADDSLTSALKDLRGQTDRTIMLWGVTHALLELAQHYTQDFSGGIIMETGGMKGRNPEITRMELHERLQKAFQGGLVCSEYGMTELFSQAYTRGGTRFHCPDSLRIMIRDVEDPFNVGLLNKAGRLNIIDLANVSTLSFIETEDLGIVHDDGTFEVLGRLDNSDVRGCNLLVAG